MPYTEEQNILTYLCFRLGLGATLAATLLSAAGLPDRPQQITSVVRADARTGKLVRRVIVTSKPVASLALAAGVVPLRVAPAPASAAVPAPPVASFPVDSFNDAVERIAAQEAIPALLIHSVIKVESNYNPFAVSPKGALGLMQLMPETARRFGVADVFNPIDNMRGGAKYLHYLLDLYNGNYTLAIAAYNAGEAAVEKYGSVPPFPETRNYVVQVRRSIELSRQAQKAPAAAPQPAPPAEPTPVEPPHIQEIVGADGIVRYVTR
jgi:soluble lytic murein transglycosylase-like protein